VIRADRDAEFTAYVTARLPALRRLAYLLCADWTQADDLAQNAIIKLYVHWGRARAADDVDAYARAVLVREFLGERRSGWSRRVRPEAQPPDAPAATGHHGHDHDHDAALDVRSALAGLPPGQRAVLVLRFYSDLSVAQAAQILGCSPGTVKSQTMRGLDALRRAIGPAAAPEDRPRQHARTERTSHG
jgi:RNA polymerase sigma-70 factor (sigma-E family)